MAAPEKNPTLLSKVLNKQHSKEKDKDISLKDKEESSTATLMTLGRNQNHNNNAANHSSLDDAKYAPMTPIYDGDFSKTPVSASASNGGSMGPGAAAAAEATLDAFKLPGCRVGERHRIFDQRRQACDYSCVFAILGIVLMIIENELTAGGVYQKVRVHF